MSEKNNFALFSTNKKQSAFRAIIGTYFSFVLKIFLLLIMLSFLLGLARPGNFRRIKAWRLRQYIFYWPNLAINNKTKKLTSVKPIKPKNRGGV